MDSYSDELLNIAVSVYETAGLAENKPMIDMDRLEAKEREYEQWIKSMRHSKMIPLGLKREDYIVHDMTLDTDMDMAEDDIQDSDLEEEEEDGQPLSYFEDNSNLQAYNSLSMQVEGILDFESEEEDEES